MTTTPGIFQQKRKKSLTPNQKKKELQFSSLLSPSDDLFKFNTFRASPNISPASSDLFVSSPSMYDSFNSLSGNNEDRLKELTHRLANRDDECDHLRLENEKLRQSVAALRAEASHEVETVRSQTSAKLAVLRETFQEQARELRSECEQFKLALSTVESKKAQNRRKSSPSMDRESNASRKSGLTAPKGLRPLVVDTLISLNDAELRGGVRAAAAELDAWVEELTQKEQSLSRAEMELKRKASLLNAKIASVNKSVAKFNARRKLSTSKQSNQFDFNPISPAFA